MCVNSVQRMLQRFKDLDTEMDVKSRMLQMDTEDNEVQALTKANFELKCQLDHMKFELEMKELETKRLEREIERYKEKCKRDSDYLRQEMEWWRQYRAG